MLKSALAGVVVAGVLGFGASAFAGGMSNPKEHTQKMMAEGMQPCFGINAACKNDCQSSGHSCAGQDTKARDPGASVLVPAARPRPAKSKPVTSQLVWQARPVLWQCGIGLRPVH